MVAAALRSCLARAYPCPAFEDACRCMRHEPARGLFPRGYTGATATLEDIALVLVVAEPGEPPAGARPMPIEEPERLVESLSTGVGSTFRAGTSGFHTNVRYLLRRCWPGLTFDEQMRRTWITEGVLCSAAATAGPIPRSVEQECGSRYLYPQLTLLPNAFVIALGRKAERRVTLTGITPHATVIAAGLPGGNSRRAKPSWDAAGKAFQLHMQRRPQPPAVTRAVNRPRRQKSFARVRR